MKISTFIILLAIATAAISTVAVRMNRISYPPSGYGVACDGKGHFCMIDADNFINQGVVFGTRQAVIDFEWQFDADQKRWRKEREARKHYDFKPCNQ